MYVHFKTQPLNPENMCVTFLTQHTQLKLEMNYN